MIDLQLLERKIQNLQVIRDRFVDIEEVDELELRECIFDVLSFIEICLNYIDEEKLSELEKKMILAIKYLCNKKKHSNIFYCYTKEITGLYSGFFPGQDTFPGKTEIYWAYIPFDKSHHKSQYKAYNELLKDKAVCTTVKQIYDFIKRSFI